MEIEFKDNEIIFNKDLSILDTFVINFVDIISKHNIKYVIVSGYVAILFGRSRISEDVDILVEYISFGKFKNFWTELEKSYECLNTSNPNEAYHVYLQSMHAIRISKKESFIPNIEIKFQKNDLDMYSLENRKTVKINNKSLLISPLELQIIYKLFLGSEKDIEDARFLFKLFEHELNNELLEMFLKELNISKNFADKYLGRSR